MNLPPGIEALPNGEWIVSHDTHFAVWSRAKGTIITDPCLFQWLKPHLEGVKVVLDLGANIGDHARWYADQGFQVIAVEPNPLVFPCLEHNVPEATCLNIAASDKDGELRFSQLENVGASRITPNGELTVQARKLDDLDLPDPCFLKCDLEGWEVFALRGMMETLKRCKPIIFCEVNRGALAANGHTPEDITDILRELGYSNIEIYPTTETWQSPQFDILVKP